MPIILPIGTRSPRGGGGSGHRGSSSSSSGSSAGSSSAGHSSSSTTTSSSASKVVVVGTTFHGGVTHGGSKVHLPAWEWVVIIVTVVVGLLFLGSLWAYLSSGTYVPTPHTLRTLPRLTNYENKKERARARRTGSKVRIGYVLWKAVEVALFLWIFTQLYKCCCRARHRGSGSGSSYSQIGNDRSNNNNKGAALTTNNNNHWYSSAYVPPDQKYEPLSQPAAAPAAPQMQYGNMAGTLLPPAYVEGVGPQPTPATFPPQVGGRS